MTFIEQSLIFIGSAVILVPIFHRLGLGSVLGYLIAGMIVGPYGLKLIQDSESVLHFSELGVVLLLFMIGLEIQPQKLWSMRRHLIGLGGMQVLVCTFIFALLLKNFGITFESSLIIGFALSLSSTAFAMQTLTERGQFNTEFGRGSFAILLMQDLLAIPALAIIPALTAGESNFSAQRFGLIILFLTFLVLVSKFLLRPIFRIIASTRSRDIFTAATLFIVLGVSAVMQKIGLSASLGTFLAGVLLAQSEYRHELETNLDPFKGLLMGLFFIAVGMGVNLTLISEKPSLIFLLSISYLFLKGLFVYLCGRIFKMSHNNSKQMAITISQGGEFAFVIFGLILQLKLANNEILDFLTAIVTLSMAINPLLNLGIEKIIERYGKKEEPVYDTIENENPKIIIAGLGRFGQIFGRILRAQGIPFVAIDHDSDQIELLRKFGTKVYYGDASRKDLLEMAGAAQAKYFILAIDEVESSLETAKMVKENFPHLKVFARARNRGHAFDLMDLGIKVIKRETFDSSVYFVRDLLKDMGMEASKAFDLIEKFKTHDEIMLEEQYKVRTDDKQFVSVSKQATAQLAQVLNEDTMKTHIARDAQKL